MDRAGAGVASRRHALAVVAVAALLALSGCTFLTGGTAGPDTPTPAPAPDDESVESVRSQALSAIDAVETYRVNGTVRRNVGAPRSAGAADPQALVDPREIVTLTTVEVNRPARELHAEDVQRSEGQTVEVETWVANGTLYANSPSFRGDPDRFRDDYGSEWVVRRPANLSERFDALDPLARQRVLLAAADLSLAGTDPETGAYVLRGTVAPETYEAVLRNTTGTFADDTDFSVTNVAVTFYVDPDTGRLQRFEGEVGLTVPTDRGVVPVLQTVSLSYDGYGDSVNVTAPTDAPAPDDGG